jgi:hypothetical protein
MPEDENIPFTTAFYSLCRWQPIRGQTVYDDQSAHHKITEFAKRNGPVHSRGGATTTSTSISPEQATYAMSRTRLADVTQDPGQCSPSRDARA